MWFVIVVATNGLEMGVVMTIFVLIVAVIIRVNLNQGENNAKDNHSWPINGWCL